jgi:diguanylate cyclase (GGDEF)-like protein
VSKRHAGHLRVVRDDAASLQPPAKGRPRDQKRGFDPMSFFVRVLILAWSGAIIATLVDEFGQLPHTPFLIAMGMTGLLAVVSFLLMRDGVPDWRGDPVQAKHEEDAEDGTDLLTQLPTFSVFQRRIQDAFGRSRRMGKQFSVILIDVNNLTAVNKEYGVLAGDEVLRHVAKAVDGTRRYNDVVARLGDDEFGVLLLDCEEQGARGFIDRLEERLSRESAAADVNGRVISLWAGICSGAATSQPAMMEADAVLEAAMESLNSAKQDRERRRRTWLSA